MIHVLYSRDRYTHKALFERLFKLRYEVFITKRGWALPSKHQQEIDQYDTEEAILFSWMRVRPEASKVTCV